MKKILTILIFTVFLLSIGLVSAHEHNLEDAKQLIDSNISCDKFTDEQLEMIGDYYMEQMHPGEAHEYMDQMMGGEGSDSLKQMHIQMARNIYCKESGGMANGSMMGSGGMMGMMPMMMGSGNIMGSGGMTGSNMMGSSMWGGSWGLWNIIGALLWIALLVALISLIIWFYKKITGQGINDSSALDILEKRFAKGEITKKEFESVKKEIR